MVVLRCTRTANVACCPCRPWRSPGPNRPSAPRLGRAGPPARGEGPGRPARASGVDVQDRVRRVDAACRGTGDLDPVLAAAGNDSGGTVVRRSRRGERQRVELTRLCGPLHSRGRPRGGNVALKRSCTPRRASLSIKLSVLNRSIRHFSLAFLASSARTAA